MEWKFGEGETPLEIDEIAGLIPSHITTQGDLNEWESNNILDAELWITQHSMALENILQQGFLRQLHKKMLAKTWQWAGIYRKSDKNIGIDWRVIPMQLQTTLDDTHYQIKHAVYSTEEIALRFHHRIVAIHPFVNGNGRHARLLTDTLLLSLKQPRFSWGRSLTASATRANYIAALRAADKHDYRLLREFVTR